MMTSIYTRVYLDWNSFQACLKKQHRSDIWIIINKKNFFLKIDIKSGIHSHLL